jgi:hypothetical protein
LRAAKRPRNLNKKKDFSPDDPVNDTGRKEHESIGIEMTKALFGQPEKTSREKSQQDM